MPDQRRPGPDRFSSKKSASPNKKFSRPARPVSQPRPEKPAPAPKKPPVTVPEVAVTYEPPEFLTVAQIASPFGLRGAVKANIQTDFPDRFELLTEVFLVAPDSKEKLVYTLLSARLQNEKQVVLRFTGITKIEQAQALRDYSVVVPLADAVPLPEGEYYIYQIIGMEVYTTDEEYVGRVINVERLPANDVYTVRGPLSKNDVLLPAIKDVVKQIDLDNNRITIELLDGLLG